MDPKRLVMIAFYIMFIGGGIGIILSFALEKPDAFGPSAALWSVGLWSLIWSKVL